MGSGTLTIYSASAGSGKTFRLAGNYLAGLFRSRYKYRRILAVTFTNKATAEMKGRILDQLHNLASGNKSQYLSELMNSTGMTGESLRKEAGEILFSILHDYSRFSVCTIDSFFQKIIRAFARESGLNSGFNMELDHSQVLESAVDEMIVSSATDARLSSWLVRYIMANMGEEKSWNIRDGILRLSEELFREKFKILSADEISNLENKEFLLDYIKRLVSMRSAFESKMSDLGMRALDIYNEYGLTEDMFFNRSRGVPDFIKSLAKGKILKPNDKVRAVTQDPPRWATGQPSRQLSEAIAGGLDNAIKSAIKLYDENILQYNSINVILSNIYALGILSDVLKKVHEVAFDNNIFLISDSAELLNLITKGDQTPFIYEKIGNRYENFMIDEFQDTSILQWNNFSPLISNSMAGGFDNLVVGDIKQSIYRFRNSDWKILGDLIDNEVDNIRIHGVALTKNFRSRSNIIRFNNSLFSAVPAIVDTIFSDKPEIINFKKLYSGAVQEDSGRAAGGYVRLELVEEPSGDEAGSDTDSGDDHGNSFGKKWKDIVLEKLPSVIETFEDKGFRPSDIGILVRDGKEGTQVLKTLIDYSGNCTPAKREVYDYNIVSNDSLLLSSSNAVIFLISVLKVMDNPGDNISRAMMVRYFLLASGKDDSSYSDLLNKDLIPGSPDFFPEGYDDFIASTMNLTLFEAVENIIDFFGLGRHPWNVAYLATFQDTILEYSRNKNADIHSFIEWWETSGESKSLVLPSDQNAIRVFTIHKSKGLEFPVVILPFLSWNLDHKSTRQPVIWVKPPPPFDGPGIVPVRYSSGLAETLFAKSYYEELFSSYLDNMNLLYVAMTRAIDAIYGFLPVNPGTNSGIAALIKDALFSEGISNESGGIVLNTCFDTSGKIFELGEIPSHSGIQLNRKNIPLEEYTVNDRPASLRLKLHSEHFFSAGANDFRERINYGKVMHEIFEGIDSQEDIPDVVRRMVLEGKIEESLSEQLITRIKDLVSMEPVNGWFAPGNKLLKEAAILLPSGAIKRPDRLVFRDGRTILIDFKFGEENPHYVTQIKQYISLLNEMGYRDIQAFIWYVDNNKIVNI